MRTGGGRGTKRLGTTGVGRMCTKLARREVEEELYTALGLPNNGNRAEEGEEAEAVKAN